MGKRYEIDFETLRTEETLCHPKRKITLKYFSKWRADEFDETLSNYYRITLDGVGSWYIDELTEAESFMEMLARYEFLPEGDPRSTEEDTIATDTTGQWDKPGYVCLDSQGKLIAEIGEDTLEEAMKGAEVYLKGPGRQEMYDRWVAGGRRMELWPPFSERNRNE
ncbi:hypothetical protein DSCO28_73410 (plasmid) [Desulfosarcina ovata subsp. sediminis]|uniref:Uncharacterized protein n=1 Tax=Desulfosarcina ovata subsp. sediminis TaxID=885957 RepID=A0A5K8A2G2_9BACT|nr:hypothetical protein [Desulfosarcina ovata]BBO86775.1 hypothetical protein DSCO28_73410 [Desulfosarcina ovata subsp. sediminis]